MDAAITNPSDASIHAHLGLPPHAAWDRLERGEPVSRVAQITYSQATAAVSLSQRAPLGRPDSLVSSGREALVAGVCCSTRATALAWCEILFRPADNLRTTALAAASLLRWVVPDVAPAALPMRGESATAEAYQEPTKSCPRAIPMWAFRLSSAPSSRRPEHRDGLVVRSAWWHGDKFGCLPSEFHCGSARLRPCPEESTGEGQPRGMVSGPRVSG
jgi:hypothetical protein